MKKWLLVPAFIIVAAFAGIYLFIPARLDIVQVTPINCTVPGAYRNMATADKWKNWWPGSSWSSNSFLFQDGRYAITKKLLNTLEIGILHNKSSIKSTLYLVPAGGDSTTLQWTCTYPTSLNPVTRIQHYRQAINLKSNMAALLNHFKSFAEKIENIYGITIQETVFKDSFLISTKKYLAGYPSVEEIYSLIGDLKKYSAAQEAKQTGIAILNITPLSPFGYQLMVALPINKPIAANGRFFNQRIPLNHFWVTRVHGGDATVKEALYQFQLYIQDHHRTLMALPFQQLITDRSIEPDTTRWITDVYVPLF
ncbi:hypothetical protein A4H97_28660 [Niastella yeongjuensis]|uniref:Bacterial transcription activator effector binding domain-containing protein n=1 Tax=Niastella yeongjuensis TaxID=354355 RepID=A0A1V9ETZ8_9BACT|nr:hypothetical protein [Niastella yeongjuensis]OQP49315.1 hypothetical protein A4H97_28660 [Niastella yeongjuensis]SEP43185.1 hypothetical protein SAMN05660816_06074 [Niastella yeongjuensis]